MLSDIISLIFLFKWKVIDVFYCEEYIWCHAHTQTGWYLDILVTAAINMRRKNGCTYIRHLHPWHSPSSLHKMKTSLQSISTPNWTTISKSLIWTRHKLLTRKAEKMRSQICPKEPQREKLELFMKSNWHGLIQGSNGWFYLYCA